MKEYTFEGRTPEDALLKAAEELNMNIRDMDYKVVEGESRMFGLVKKVTVHVKVPDEQVQAMEEEKPAMESVIEKPVAMPDPAPAVEETEKPTGILIGDEVGNVLNRLIHLMGMTATTSMEETDQEVRVDLYSESPEELTGTDGRVLSSIQFIVNRIVNRKAEARKHVLIDVDGFKERREEQLREDALSLVAQAVEAKKIFKMGPMNSRDRRIVHLALKDNTDVSTRSEGTGPNRRLLIIPRGYRGNRSQNNGRKRGRNRKQGEANGNQKTSVSE